MQSESKSERCSARREREENHGARNGSTKQLQHHTGEGIHEIFILAEGGAGEGGEEGGI